MSNQDNPCLAVDHAVELNSQSVAPRRSLTAADLGVYGLILGLGALQFGLYQRSDDFFTGDTTYFELARSIIENGFYGFDFKPETLLPPGFPVILALLCTTVSCSYAVLIRSMSVFATLGFIASYELLLVLEGGVVAAVSCLLLGSSPIIFAFTTQIVSSDLPYFFSSLLTLLFATRLDTAKSPRARAALWLLCGFFLVGSLLIRSAGIALLTGLFAWLVVSFFAYRRAATQRLKTFLPLLFLGIVVQSLWMYWAVEHEVLQWPMVRGYPQSYVSQLSVKNGQHPELGTASLSDIPLRVTKNLNDRAVVLMELLTRRYIHPAWFSPLVFGPVVLILVGVGCSIRCRGGGLLEWYFVSHEAMYLLWPWDFRIRFFLPVVPFACLYLWRGGKALLNLASQRPRVVGAWSFPLSIFLGVYAGVWSWGSGSVQPKLSAVFWVLAATVSAWMAWTGRPPVAFAPFLSRSGMGVSIWGKSLTLLQVGGMLTVAVLVVVGIAQQLSIGRDNLTFDLATQPSYPDVEAAKWIRAHTASTAVVMARQLDVVYHYSRRKVVWFPPSSNPQLLMEGIRKYKVEFVIVTSKESSYWLPPEQDCFELLFRAYPRTFRLIHEEPRFRIFEIVPDSSE